MSTELIVGLGFAAVVVLLVHAAFHSKPAPRDGVPGPRRLEKMHQEQFGSELQTYKAWKREEDRRWRRRRPD